MEYYGLGGSCPEFDRSQFNGNFNQKDHDEDPRWAVTSLMELTRGVARSVQWSSFTVDPSPRRPTRSHRPGPARREVLSEPECH
jgi:hypothetical protein